MYTQADKAEKILQKNGSPMHYNAIVDEAIKLKLIEHTAKNANTLYANVRKAIATDARFTKIAAGVFDLASRQGNVQAKISQQEESVHMSITEAKTQILFLSFKQSDRTQK